MKYELLRPDEKVPRLGNPSSWPTMSVAARTLTVASTGRVAVSSVLVIVEPGRLRSRCV